MSEITYENIQKPIKPISVDNEANELIERLIFLKRKYPILYINITGISGTGKTNTAFFLYDKVFKNYDFRYYYNYFKQNNGKYKLALNDIIEELKTKKYIYVIFDDMSFLFKYYKKAMIKFLHDLMLIRHYINDGIFVFIQHYVKSILPIFRNTHVFILTSLFPTQIHDYTYFTYDALYRFIDINNNSLNHYILVNAFGKYYIVKVGLSDSYINFMKNIQ